MDIEKDKEFFWLAKESLNAPLPKGWTERKLQRTGQSYYVNKETGESVWEHPADETYKKRFVALKKLKLAETAKANQAENNTTSEPTDGTYDAMPTSPKVELLKSELASIREKKKMVQGNKSAAATLDSIRKEHGRLEKKILVEETKQLLKKQSDSMKIASLSKDSSERSTLPIEVLKTIIKGAKSGAAASK